MGFFARLFNRPGNDTTVTDYQAEVAARAANSPVQAMRASATTGTFRMPVEDVFSITGRGTVVTGTVAEGSVRVGDEVTVGAHRTRVTGVEKFREIVTDAGVGEHVGLLLEGLSRDMIVRGDEVRTVR
ncbi:hypothetical protein BH10ACT7_BH10ACT7_21380 [soil metagenome]